MEFKGTKGKWEVGGDTVDGILISSNHPQNRDIATIWRYDNDFLENQEMRANALLISKAPEMLEMLKKLKDAMLELMGHQDGWEEDYEELEKLIKEATEL